MSKSIKKNFGFTQKPTVGKAPTTEEKKFRVGRQFARNSVRSTDQGQAKHSPQLLVLNTSLA